MHHTARINVIRNTFNAVAELSLSRSSYRHKVFSLFDGMIAEDVQHSDVSQLPKSAYAAVLTAKIVAKSPAVLAGLDEAICYLSRRELDVRSDYQNSQLVNPGDILLEINGKAAEILTMERSILNILQRLSGIATTTKFYVDKTAGTTSFIVGTRKTLWGLIDKRAIQCGGGLTHRLGLYDAAMLKENHLTILRNSNNPTALHDAVAEIISTYPYLRFIEIEVADADNFSPVLEYLENITAPFPFVIMFDHFEPAEIKVLISTVKSKPIYNHLLFEASGNINLDTVEAYAGSDVDVISIGALTHSVNSADFSLLIE